MRFNLFSAVMVTIFCSWESSAQILKFGVVGGVTVTDAITNNSSVSSLLPGTGESLFQQTFRQANESRFYTVGPSIEVRFTDRFSAEFDALYKRLGRSYFSQSLAPNLALDVRERGNSWEFPLIGKFYLTDSDRKLRLYVGTGWSFRKIWVNSEGTSALTENGTTTISPFRTDSTSDTGVGAVFAGGLRWDVGRFALTPEFRYTRWGGSENLNTNRNQAEILFGIRF